MRKILEAISSSPRVGLWASQSSFSLPGNNAPATPGLLLPPDYTDKDPHCGFNPTPTSRQNELRPATSTSLPDSNHKTSKPRTMVHRPCVAALSRQAVQVLEELVHRSCATMSAMASRLCSSECRRVTPSCTSSSKTTHIRHTCKRSTRPTPSKMRSGEMRIKKKRRSHGSRTGQSGKRR
jgi:hypothetical protein